MKRQASDLQEPQVKHARADDKPPGPIDLTYKPQETGTFLRLPRELRDQIYGDVFGKINIRLVHQGFEYLVLDRRSSGFLASVGLPPWVRTCKQMTEEAIEVLASTCSFSAISNIPPIGRPSSNPLVFRPGHVRSIVVDPDVEARWAEANTLLSAHAYCEDPTAKFLISLEHMQVKEGQLHINWHRWWHGTDQPNSGWLAPKWLENEPGIWTDDWTDYWTGRFRKVSIDVVVHTDPDAGDASTKLVELAETLATRLVGSEGAATWESSYTGEYNSFQKWTRCVTVERKM